MAKFNFDQYSADKAARQTSKEGKGNLPKIHYMGEFLNDKSNSVIVRFPYSSMADVLFESVHKVIGTFENNRFGKWVRCTGDENCPLCNSADAGEKKRTMRFFAKMLVYTVDNGSVVINPTVWDRPSMFADADIKNLIAEYGDLKNYLFKITRTGKGTDTRYTILPVMNKTVYPDESYVADFSSLDRVDPSKILSKSMEQYETALTGSAVEDKSSEETVVEEPTAAPDPTPYVEPTPVVESPAVNAPSTSQPTVKKYTF